MTIIFFWREGQLFIIFVYQKEFALLLLWLHTTYVLVLSEFDSANVVVCKQFPPRSGAPT